MSLIVTPGQFTQRAELYHQLAQLTSAGIRRRSRAGTNQTQSARPVLPRAAPGTARRTRQGRDPRRSTAASLDWLPEFDIALIEAGERSGRLDACFRLLADYYNDRARIIKQVISQLIYPVGLVHFAAFIFLIVLPFAHSQFNASLILLFARAALVLSPLYCAVALMIYATQSKHGENWRARIESLLRPVPILGTARHYLALARLAAALEALISAGVNIIEAWDLAATASGSPALRRAVAAWKPQVTAGQTPAEVVRALPRCSRKRLPIFMPAAKSAANWMKRCAA